MCGSDEDRNFVILNAIQFNIHAYMCDDELYAINN